MHGNEVLGREMLLKLADYMCEKYNEGDPLMKKLIHSTRIHLLPSMNPDGWQVATDSVSNFKIISNYNEFLFPGALQAIGI